jgi:hypothetical protein
MKTGPCLPQPGGSGSISRRSAERGEPPGHHDAGLCGGTPGQRAGGRLGCACPMRVQDAGAAPGVGADAAIKPCRCSAIHRSVGMGHATILMLSSASAMDLAPGITDATAGCTRMQASGRNSLRRWSVTTNPAEGGIPWQSHSPPDHSGERQTRLGPALRRAFRPHGDTR